MLRLALSILSGIVIGVAGTLITLNWQEEKLRFELGLPATFGEIVYQNLAISNDGWNPATNVKVFLKHPGVGARNVQSAPAFNLDAAEPELIGGYDRLRRGETVTITFSFKGAPIEARTLSIKSDRSVARPMVRDSAGIDVLSLTLGVLIGVLLTMGSPAIHNLLHALHQLAIRSIKPRGPDSGTP
jgi:hypothetical protein